MGAKLALQNKERVFNHFNSKMPAKGSNSVSEMQSGMSNMMDNPLLKIDVFVLCVSIAVVFIMYMTHQWSYWIKILWGLLMLSASCYFTFPFKPTNLPFYVLFIYIFVDYLEFNNNKNGNGGAKRKKK
jgi:hypothetical protein